MHDVALKILRNVRYGVIVKDFDGMNTVVWIRHELIAVIWNSRVQFKSPSHSYPFFLLSR